MGTTFRCINIIYKSITVLCIGIIVLHGNFNHNTIFFTFTVNNLRIQCFLTSVQVSNKFADTAFVVEYLFFFLIFSRIFQNNTQAFGKECHLTETLLQNIIIINCFFKNLLIRQECDLGSCTVLITVTDHPQRIHCMTSLVSLLIFFTLAVNGNFQPFRQCIYNRGTYAVKSAGYLISPTAEFTTCMKDSKYNFYCRYSRFMVNSYRNASSVINYCNGIIRINSHLDFGTKSC